MLSDILFCEMLRLWRGGRAAVSVKANETEYQFAATKDEALAVSFPVI
jgi:hypothetical protein